MEADQASQPAAVQGSGPASGAAKHKPATKESSAVQQLMNITNASADECMQALDACDGNVDVAAGMLMGL